IGGARGQHDAHRLLHALEDARVDVGLVPLRRAVDDPDRRAVAPQLLPHLLEAGTVQETCDGDEADDARAVLVAADRLAMTRAEYLERRPPPEIDVEVLQMLGVSADTPADRRRPQVHWRRRCRARPAGTQGSHI